MNDFRRARRLCLLATVAAAGLGVLLAPAVVRVGFGAKYAGAVTPLRILLIGELGIAVYHMDGASLDGLGRLGSVSMAAMAGEK